MGVCVWPKPHIALLLWLFSLFFFRWNTERCPIQMWNTTIMSVDYAKRIAFIRRLFLTSLTTSTTTIATTTTTTTNHSTVDLHISQNIIMIKCFTQNQCDFHYNLLCFIYTCRNRGYRSVQMVKSGWIPAIRSNVWRYVHIARHFLRLFNFISSERWNAKNERNEKKRNGKPVEWTFIPLVDS